MQDISELEEIVAEKYQAKLGGKKGNLTLYSFDGKYKVVRSFADRIVFNEAAKSAEALFKECVLEWGNGADPKLVTLVNYAFETDKQGNLSASKNLWFASPEYSGRKNGNAPNKLSWTA